MSRQGWGSAALLVTVAACSEPTVSEPPDPQPPAGCEAPEVALADGSCILPGVLADGCAEGFAHDGAYGCEPILPTEPCPPGLMAIPGETACRPVMDCGSGPWGNLPIDATTVYVDASFGGAGDGTASAPYPTISAAVDAAAPGALVAVAAGTYLENVVIAQKPVRLWGVCPDLVTITSANQPSPCPPAAVCVVDDANGTEVGGVSLTGPGAGVVLTDVQDVVVDRVRAHDNALGIAGDDGLGPASLELRDSLFEGNDRGVYLQGVEGHIERSVLRGASTAGLQLAATCEPFLSDYVCSAMASATVHRSVVEGNLGTGVFARGSHLLVTDSVVRGTFPSGPGRSGIGVMVRPACDDQADALSCDLAARPTLGIMGSVVEDNHENGIFVMATDATVERSVVRRTYPAPGILGTGRGLGALLACGQTSSGIVCDPSARANLVLTASLIDQSHDAGLHVTASDATVDHSVIRTTFANEGKAGSGRGVSAQPACVATGVGSECDPDTSAQLFVGSSLVTDHLITGVFVGGSAATLDRTVVRATSGADGLGGDGVVVIGSASPASAVLFATTIEQSARAGLSVFGASASLAQSSVRCASIPLTGEMHLDRDFAIADEGGNRCGCEADEGVCKIVSAGLSPPEADVLP